MQILLSDLHRLHAPTHEFTPVGLTPYSECPQRAEQIAHALRHEPWTEFVAPNSHGMDPNRAYPFFSGYADEAGTGRGKGLNHNFPLGPETDETRYLECLDRVCEIIRAFVPAFLVISLGVDTYEGDPLGDFALPCEFFTQLGAAVSAIERPTLIVQEGGYDLDRIGACVVRFLREF